MNKDQDGNTKWGFYLVANDYVEPVYEVKIGTGEKIEMTAGEDNQYFVTGVSVSAGDTIEYFYDGDGITDSTAKAVNNNNLNESKQVLVDNDSADIYINVVNKTIWVSGMADGGYHIILNNHILVTMTKGDDFEGFEQYYSDSINFAKDDVIRFVNTERAEPNHLPIVFDITTINPAQLGSNFEVSGGSIVCKSAVSATVYLKLKYEADEVFFGEVSPAVARAIEYAEDFMDKIDTACNGGDPDQSTLVTAWNAQKTTYLGLDEAVQTELLKGSESSVQEIRDFAAMYKYVYGRRGTAWGLNNFLNWDIASLSNNVLITKNNGHIALIAIASIIVISTFGFAFFSLKKKRQH